MRDRAGNFVLPRADVLKLRDRLRNEELVAGSYLARFRRCLNLQHESTGDMGHRRELCAHARILALEEAIDTEWVCMWDKFGGYLLLLLGLTAKAERVQVMDYISFPNYHNLFPFCYNLFGYHVLLNCKDSDIEFCCGRMKSACAFFWIV